MNLERWERILASVRHHTTSGPLVAHLCTVTKDLLQLDAVSICLGSDHDLLPLEGSDPEAVVADNLQILWGVGPTIAAASSHHAARTTIAISDVTTETDSRWPLLAELHTGAGLSAVVTFGLRTGGAHLGVLSGYNRRPRALTTHQLADGLVLATLITEVLLGLHAVGPHHPSPTGTRPHANHVLTTADSPTQPPVEIPPTQFEELLKAVPVASAQIHQAAGIIAERLQISVLDAQIRLRALAFRRGDTLEAFSRLIVAHRQIPEFED